jgi:hypothetical protein
MIRMILATVMGTCMLDATGVSSALAVHPFHVCVAQMEWNADAKLWEVSLRLHPQDLEKAMTRSRGMPTSLEDHDFPELAIPFLNDQFFLVFPTQPTTRKELLESIERGETLSRSQLRWVGMEQERGWLWIHAELQPPADNAQEPTAGAPWLVHRIFLDQIDRQENSARIISGTQRYSLQFKAGEEAHSMKGTP